MRLPSLPRDGMSVAKICTDLINYIKVSRLTSVRGGILRQTPSGQVLEIDTPPPETPHMPQPLTAARWYDKDSDEWRVTVSPGHLVSQNIVDGGLIRHMPTMDGESLDAEEPPYLVLPSNDCFVFMEVRTNNKGRVIADPEIRAEVSAPTDTHHTPPDPVSGGSSGYYNFILAEFQNNTESTLTSPEIVELNPGTRFMPNQLVEIENIPVTLSGDETGAGIYSDYSPGSDKHQLRQLIGYNGVTVTEEAASIRIEASGALSLPWAVTSNGDDTVAVAKGVAGWWEEQTSVNVGNPGVGIPFVHRYFKQAAVDPVTVTADGFIIFAYDTDVTAGPYHYEDGSSDSFETYRPGEWVSGESVRFSTDPTGEPEDIVLVLAEVSLLGGVVTVDEQILTHNPIVHIPYTNPSS